MSAAVALPRERVLAARTTFLVVALVPLACAITGGPRWWGIGLVGALTLAVTLGVVLWARPRLEEAGTGLLRGAFLATAVYLTLWSVAVGLLGD